MTPRDAYNNGRATAHNLDGYDPMGKVASFHYELLSRRGFKEWSRGWHHVVDGMPHRQEGRMSKAEVKASRIAYRAKKKVASQ